MISAAQAMVPLRVVRIAWRRGLHLWDRVAIYAPLAMMGALALGTYWLVRNTPVALPVETVKEARHEVDYFLNKFTVKTFDEKGQLKSDLFGVEARHYSDTDILEIDAVRIRSVSLKGRVSNATANRGYVNGDGSEVQLAGNAVVVREAGKDVDGKEAPRMEFRGEFLHAFLNDERVQSHKPVLLIRGQDQFTGDTFDYNNLDQVANLKGRVRGLLVPRSAANGTGGTAAGAPAPLLTQPPAKP